VELTLGAWQESEEQSIDPANHWQKCIVGIEREQSERQLTGACLHSAIKLTDAKFVHGTQCHVDVNSEKDRW